MEVEPATRYHLTKLFERPAKRMKIEYRNAGYSLPEAKSYFVGLIADNRAVTFMERGKPLAILGWETNETDVRPHSWLSRSTLTPAMCGFCADM